MSADISQFPSPPLYMGPPTPQGNFLNDKNPMIRQPSDDFGNHPMSQQIPYQMSQQIPYQMSQQIPYQMSQQTPYQMSQQTPYQMSQQIPQPMPEYRSAEECDDARAQYEQMQLRQLQKEIDNQREMISKCQAIADSGVQTIQGMNNNLSQTRQGLVQRANAEVAQQMQQQQMQQTYGQPPYDPYAQQFGNSYGPPQYPCAQQFGSPFGPPQYPCAQQFGSPFGPPQYPYGPQSYYQPSQPFTPSMIRDTRTF